MKRLLSIAALVVVLAGGTAYASTNGRERDAAPGDTTLEVVGQVTNTGTSSIQYGYLPFVHGVDTTFGPGAQNESTALYTFYTSANTTRVITNGPLRVITRDGTTTIYSDPDAGSTFADPDTFRDGTPIEISTLQQQVVVDTTTGAFTTTNVNTITWSARSGDVELGARFRTTLNGHLNATPPPSAYMAGFSVAMKKAHGH
jgi:hypothetical protein